MEKQIEEMANEICANNGTEFCASGRCYKQWECPLNFNSLEILYNAGYRKQVEAEWLYNKGHGIYEYAYYCSNCYYGTNDKTNFCACCGAKMKGAE
jgi:hypothetical protein